MSEGNVEVFRQSVASFNRAMQTGDAQDWHRHVEEFLAPDIEFVNPQDAVDSGTRHGHAGMNAVWESWRRAFDWMQAEPDRVIDAGDHVVSMGVIRGQGRGSGLEIEQRYGQIMTFRDRKIVRWENFNQPFDALRAAGLVDDGPIE